MIAGKCSGIYSKNLVLLDVQWKTDFRNSTQSFCLLLSDPEQFPVAAVCSGTDENLHISSAVIWAIMNLLDCSFFI